MPKTKEQFQKMREDMREKILKMSSLYFARCGFGDTKISDLAKHIGIGQGTIYLYFKSKEELFDEIRNNADNKDEIKKLKLLSKLPIPAKTKIDKISNEMCRRLTEDEEYAVKITLLTQILLEREDIYSDDLYKEMAKIIRQGQKEGDIVKGDALYLADLYWGNVYLYALKRLFSTTLKSLKKETLNRLLEA
ncbi:transcriptional regulator, TetR family [Lachnospiraceae bacterium XBB2008]|nr:transcriptional regulator, TetR family [Lachnospiraceae bacterium XBB2008]